MGILFRLPLGMILPSPAQGNKTLLVRDDLIGDLAVPTSAVIKWLSDTNRDPYLVLRHDLLPVGRLFLQRDKLIPVDISKYKRSVSYRYSFLKNLRSIGFHTAIGSVTHSEANSDIVRYSGAAEQWGYRRSSRDDALLRGIKAVDCLPVKGNNQYVSILEHEKWLLSAVFGVETEDIDLKPFATRMGSMIPMPHLKLPKRYIHYIIDASDPRRAFPPDRLLPILINIAELKEIQVVITASKRYRFEDRRCVNLTGRTNLKELFRVVGGADWVIGNESGITHLSWAMGNKTAMFYGGGRYGRYMPPSGVLLLSKSMSCHCCDWKCIQTQSLAASNIYPCINLKDSEIDRALRQFAGTSTH